MKRLMLFVVAAGVVALILHQGSPAQEAVRSAAEAESRPYDDRFDGGRGGRGGDGLYDGRGGLMGATSDEFSPLKPLPRKSPLEDSEDRKLTNEDGALSGKIFELTRRLKGAASAEERADAEKQIAEAVAKQFEIRQALRESQLVELEQQVKRLRTIHAERANQRDRIVSDRVQQLLREADGLGWGDAGDAPGNFGTTSKRLWNSYPEPWPAEPFEPAKKSPVR